MATPGIAAGAYASLARLTEAASATKPAGEGAVPGGGLNFGSLLKDAIANVSQAGRAADVQAQAAATGKANVVDVVTAVAETETAIEALVSVRDKVIQAYEEILRMPI